MEQIIILERFIYGIPAANGDSSANLPRILALSSGLTIEEAGELHALVTLEPVLAPVSLAVGLYKNGQATHILARARYQNGDPARPIHEYLLIPRSFLEAVSGNIRSLVEITAEPLPEIEAPLQPLEALTLPAMPTWSTDKRHVLFAKLKDELGDLRPLFRLLGAALHERGLLISGYRQELDSRLDLVEGLLLLLPPQARAEVTFATNVANPNQAGAFIVFSEFDGAADRWTADFYTGDLPDFDELRTPYIQMLETLWQGDIEAFITELKAVSAGASRLMAGKNLRDGLDAVAERQRLDARVLAGEEVPAETIKSVLTHEPPAAGPLRTEYALRLLRHALGERDTDAANLVARYMDEDTALDEALNQELNNTLEIEPDSVYLFIRTRLNQGMDDRWLPRLHTAAVVSLRVAINDGDSETLSSWLRLIAREPANYHLSDVLQEGILAAQRRTYEDGDLGAQLILFAAKRAPGSLDMLLDDAALVNALPYPLGPALRSYEPEAVSAVLGQGREIAQVLMGRAARVAGGHPDAAAVFSPAIIEYVWNFFREGQTLPLPEPYRLVHILNLLAAEGVKWLPEDTLKTLLTLIVRDQRVEMLQKAAAGLADNPNLVRLLADAHYESKLPPDRILNLIGQIAASETISQQQAVDVYLTLLDDMKWNKTALPLAEQAARLLQQNIALEVEPDVLWRLAQYAGDTRSDAALRAVSKRLMGIIVTLQDDRLVVEQVARLHEHVHWSSSARAALLSWWREFALEQTQARLQHFDKALDGKRSLEEFRAVVQTTLAFRKMLGKRSLEEFARAIGMAFNVLQALSESFDPQNRHNILFDQETLHAELETHTQHLSADQRNVLARNLKELAGLVIMMAEYRSKATLMRRGENIERQLLTGEQEPQSAIDIMKWLAGYFSGMQEKGEDENGKT